MANLTLTAAGFSASTKPGFGQMLSSGRASLSPPPTQSGDFSVSVVAHQSSSKSGTAVIVGQRGLYWIGTIDDKLSVRYGNGLDVSALIETTLNISDGVARRIMLCVSEAGGYLFADGQLVGSNQKPLSSTTPEYVDPLTIREGFANDNTGFYFTGSVDEVALFSEALHSDNFTDNGSPYTGSEQNLKHLWNFDGNGNDSKIEPEPEPEPEPDGVLIKPDDTSIYYSPYNWLVSNSEAKSINAGAYFKVMVNSPSISLRFDISSMPSTVSKIVIRVDGRTWQEESLQSEVTVTMPEGQDNSVHLLEVIFDGLSSSFDRWQNQDVAIRFTGMTLGTNGTVSRPHSKPLNILVYGDSITEGVRTLVHTASDDVGRNSAAVCWPLEMAKLLNAEIGVVGFGSQGIITEGRGNVPTFESSYNYLWESQTRDFSVNPDLCLWLHGTNDGAADIVSSGITIINSMLTLMPETRFVLLRPLNGDLQASNLSNIVSSCSEPHRVRYQSTEGVWESADSSDGLHPYGYSGLNDIAPNFASFVSKDLNTPVFGLSQVRIEVDDLPDGSYKTALLSEDGRALLNAEIQYVGGAALRTVELQPGRACEGFLITEDKANSATIYNLTE